MLDKQKKSCNIAIVASIGLGDGLVFLILAYNLQRQGYTVTFYNNPLSELQNWVSNITLKPYPTDNDMAAYFAKYDLVITEKETVITRGVPVEQYPQLAQRYVFLGLGSIDSRLIFDHSARFLKTVSDPGRAQQLIKLARLSGAYAPSLDRTQSMASNMVTLCKKVLGFENVTKYNGLLPPAAVQYRKYPSRIIIHPLSALPKKNWSARKFIQLARALQQQGWQPVFTVSPKERDQWLQVVGDEFSTPLFPTIDALARFIGESGFLIGNDSGNGHLASNLGIPTLTILNRKDKFFRWRPDWAPGAIVVPVFTFKFLGKRYWRPFLTVKRVLEAFKKIVQIDHTTLVNLHAAMKKSL